MGAAIGVNDAVGAPEDNPYGPYLTLDREHWASLAASRPASLDEATLDRLRGIGDPTDAAEVREVYAPLTELLSLYMERTGALFSASHQSTTSRLLKELISRLPGSPRVDLVTTDGFLYPNERLESEGLLDRKGYPESYDRRRLVQFVMDVKSGTPEVTAPVYSHLVYDIVPNEVIRVSQPDVLIVEGLNVLQPARRRSDGTTGLALSDFFDFSVYVDAAHGDIRNWYVSRFLKLRETAFRDPDSYFVRFGRLSEAEATAIAIDIWNEINGPNLELNIRPTRGRATAILRKGPDHQVSWVRIRKV
jgi:type I pantothenate kinase